MPDRDPTGPNVFLYIPRSGSEILLEERAKLREDKKQDIVEAKEEGRDHYIHSSSLKNLLQNEFSSIFCSSTLPSRPLPL